MPAGLPAADEPPVQKQGGSNDSNPTLPLTSYSRIFKACHGSSANIGEKLAPESL